MEGSICGLGTVREMEQKIDRRSHKLDVRLCIACPRRFLVIIVGRPWSDHRWNHTLSPALLALQLPELQLLVAGCSCSLLVNDSCLPTAIGRLFPRVGSLSLFSSEAYRRLSLVCNWLSLCGCGSGSHLFLYCEVR